MTHEPLDLKELDRLEAATQERQYYAHPKRHNPPYFLMRSREEVGTWGSVASYGAEWHELELSAGVRNQLRPLLDLVEKMEKALKKQTAQLDRARQKLQLGEIIGALGPIETGDAHAALDDYRRAKGEA